MYEANFELNTQDVQANLILNVTPDKLSQLENDTDFQTGEEVNSIVQSATSEIESIENTLLTYGNIVTHNVTEFATATQGTLAETALQPNDNITELNNNAGYITNSAIGNGTITFTQGGVTKGTITTNQSGNSTIEFDAGTGITIDSELSTTSTNPVQNKVITTELNKKIETIKVNGTTQTITSKTVDITVPTNNNQLTNGAGYITSSALAPYALSANLSTVATSGSYNDLSNKPTIPAVNNATLTIQRNGTTVKTFTANASTNVTANISVPTTATEVGALPSTTTINDLTSTAQQNALNSGVTSSTVSAVASNTSGISVINSLIPSTTTVSNPLADKAFVNSSVQTATANFRGNWATWSAVPTNTNDYPEDYTGSKTPTVNDYLVVQDASGYTGTTLEGTWRFKYSGTWSTDGKSGWLPEYQVNETPMTAAQLAALNSGVTAATVTQVATNTSAIAGKQDTLTAGANIQINSTTISATDTTYSNGTGLNLSGTTFSVDFTEVATATQGGKADTALQPNDNITQLNNNAGYQANVIETIKVNGTAQSVSSKTVNISVPSAVTEATVSGWGFTKNVGTVTSVNNVSPVNGNVTITIPDSATWGNITGTLSNQTDLNSALNGKQATLVSGTNIKTINNTSLLGSGNIDIQGGGSITVDTTLSTTSTNPVQNKVVTSAIQSKTSVTFVDWSV